MDPNAALFNLLECLADKEPDREEVLGYLENLHHWIYRGGFLPTVYQKGLGPDGVWQFGVKRSS